MYHVKLLSRYSSEKNNELFTGEISFIFILLWFCFLKIMIMSAFLSVYVYVWVCWWRFSLIRWSICPGGNRSCHWAPALNLEQDVSLGGLSYWTAVKGSFYHPLYLSLSLALCLEWNCPISSILCRHQLISIKSEQERNLESKTLLNSNLLHSLHEINWFAIHTNFIFT